MKSNDFLADVKPSRISNREMAAIAADPETYKRHYENDPAETKVLAAEIRHRVTIKDLAHLCTGWECKKGVTCSPFRNESTASFSVSDDYKEFYDFGNEEYKGDVFDFYRFATGCDSKQAFKDLLIMAGLRSGDAVIRAPVQRYHAEELDAVKVRHIPELGKPTHDELAVIEAQRKISIPALDIAVSRGLLWTSTLRGCPSWVLTDQARNTFLARRLDGGTWDHIGGKKAWLLPGSNGKWPIGAKEAAPYPAIALCEGGPDFLSVFEFALVHNVEGLVAPVCKSSSSGDIDDAALSYFTEKRIRIFVHSDKAGRDAAIRWTRQLGTVNAKVDAWRFDGLRQADGKPVEDLNDLLRCQKSDNHTYKPEVLMDFALEGRD
jgi:hypothetical protein